MFGTKLKERKKKKARSGSYFGARVVVDSEHHRIDCELRGTEGVRRQRCDGFDYCWELTSDTVGIYYILYNIPFGDFDCWELLILSILLTTRYYCILYTRTYGRTCDSCHTTVVVRLTTVAVHDI